MAPFFELYTSSVADVDMYDIRPGIKTISAKSNARVYAIFGAEGYENGDSGRFLRVNNTLITNDVFTGHNQSFRAYAYYSDVTAGDIIQTNTTSDVDAVLLVVYGDCEHHVFDANNSSVTIISDKDCKIYTFYGAMLDTPVANGTRTMVINNWIAPYSIKADHVSDQRLSLYGLYSNVYQGDTVNIRNQNTTVDGMYIIVN